MSIKTFRPLINYIKKTNVHVGIFGDPLQGRSGTLIVNAEDLGVRIRWTGRSFRPVITVHYGFGDDVPLRQFFSFEDATEAIKHYFDNGSLF